MIKKHVFFIEGGDNVGKTTTIEAIKDSSNIQAIIYDKISFIKYPSGNLTSQINELTKSIAMLDKNYDVDSTLDYRTIKNRYIDDIIGLMISDMNDSFMPNIIPNIIHNDHTCQICDRGPLSTYLYQYRGYNGLDTLDNIPVANEKNLLEQFIKSYVPNSPNDLNVIILHNSKTADDIDSSKEETIAYKKLYDKDIKLQTRVNNSLNNIVEMIKQNQLSNSHIKFFYIDIFDSEGNRKSTQDVCSEVIKIINRAFTGGKYNETS
jgi:thymidylate kinase